MSLMKRKIQYDDVSSSTDKKMKAGTSAAEQQAANDGESGEDSSPIPRGPQTKSFTMHFVQRSWEEISSLTLSYILLAMTPIGFWDNENRQMVQRFLQEGFLYTVDAVKFKINNFIVLNDQLAASGDTPQEISSVVQRAKIVHFTPNCPMANCYELYDGDKQLRFPLPADAHDPNIDYFSTVPISSFESLRCKGIPNMSTVNRRGTNDENVYPNRLVNPQDYIGREDYFPGGGSGGGVREAAVQYGPYLGLNRNIWSFHSSEGSVGHNRIQTRGATPGIQDDIIKYDTSPIPTIAHVKNQHGFSIISPSDEISETVTTNLGHGCLLEKEAPTHNSTAANSGIQILDSSVIEIPYVETGLEKRGSALSIPQWPSTMTPLIHKGDLLRGAGAIRHKPKPLKHHFLTMIPIKEANGSIMKQRAVCMYQQEITMTFYFNEMTDTYTADGYTDTSFPFSPYQWRTRVLEREAVFPPAFRSFSKFYL